jgi:uncharacterized protein YbjT (DUF2867 family)
MILVVGATGFIGSHLVRRLHAEGRPLRALVREPARAEFPKEVEVVVGDVTEPSTLGPAMTGVDVVVHTAAIVANVKEPYRGAYDAVNRVGTENLVTAAKQAGVQRFVLQSGMDTRPGAPGSYMATRWGMEEAVRTSGLAYTILQPSVIFGDGAPFVVELAKLARVFPVVPAIGGSGVMFQPIWIEDVVGCLVRSIDDDALLGAAHPIGGGEQVSFRQIIQAIGRAMGKSRTTLPLPVPIARLQAALMNAVLPHPPLTPASIELFTLNQTTDLDSVERRFGFRPRGFSEHLAAHGITG